MNLYHFEDEVNSIIVDRGLDYYESGSIADLVYVSDGRYRALVEGTDMYVIYIQIDEKGNILSSDCGCPYDGGPVCKHEVAVYYELIDQLEGSGQVEDARLRVTSNRPELKVVLENLPHEKLVEILVELAAGDPVLRDKLIFSYVKLEDEQEVYQCKRLIDSIVRRYKGKEGYITYRYTGDFAEELSVLLDKIETLENPLVAIEISELLMGEAIEALHYTDDSDGDIGGLLDQTIEMMNHVVTVQTDPTKQKMLLDKILQLTKEQYFEDFEIELLDICVRLAVTEELRSVLMNELQTRLMPSIERRTDHYANERILNLMYDIMETHGSTEEALQFLHDNVKYSSFRERLMQHGMDEGNYENVIALAFAGERQDRDYRGLLTRWKKWRYEAYKQLKSSKEQSKMGRELLKEGNFEYYWDLKELAAGDETALYEQLKKELAINHHRMYLQLIEAEKDIDALLDYVHKNPSTIEQYMEYLLDDHEETVIHLFEEHIKIMAEAASNRSRYKEVCQALRRFQKVAGSEMQSQLVEELETAYKRRPAFLDELGKI
ncbi:SWIM zinc finger domain-containing protein [Sporosarcina sp. HYO08]|uniref:SWIM zinc finger family protein n=1 Tax=Sporosarcina sp. HYO08 TaxID=1759557 RepID=UPI000797EC75|nr:hypothetical protein [Sporosarcina sp. HYO08]KXH87014.1 hypothetical protein AU377_00065 [Sporosarcina sp. HYO08]